MTGNKTKSLKLDPEEDCTLTITFYIKNLKNTSEKLQYYFSVPSFSLLHVPKREWLKAIDLMLIWTGRFKPLERLKPKWASNLQQFFPKSFKWQLKTVQFRSSACTVWLTDLNYNTGNQTWPDKTHTRLNFVLFNQIIWLNSAWFSIILQCVSPVRHHTRRCHGYWWCTRPTAHFFDINTHICLFSGHCRENRTLCSVKIHNDSTAAAMKSLTWKKKTY